MKKIVTSGVMLLVILLFSQSGAAEQVDGLNQSDNRWNGTWTDGNYTITFIQQNETDIRGIYEPFDLTEYDPGRLEGTLSENGNVFSGRWIEAGVSTLNLSDDGMSFMGTGKSNPIEGLTEPTPYEYNGTRTGEIMDPENIWTGEWTTSIKTYNLTQNGRSISGENHPLPDVKDEDGFLEGTVSDDGKSITYNWTETGDFSFALSEDSVFINGTYTVDLSSSDKPITWNMTRFQ